MKYIQSLLTEAFNATRDVVSLRLEPRVDLVRASLVDEDDNIVTLQTDWEVDLVAEGATASEALAALDALCARDYPDGAL